MSNFYLDTSALFKQYHDEEGSEFVNALFDYRLKSGAIFYTSMLSAVEFCSAVRRHQREGGIDNETAEGIITVFLEESEHSLLTIPFEQHMIQTSIKLLANHPLKGYDAVQLSTCLEMMSSISQTGELYFVCDDERLCRAAKAEGLQVLQPRMSESISLLKLQ